MFVAQLIFWFVGFVCCTILMVSCCLCFGGCIVGRMFRLVLSLSSCAVKFQVFFYCCEVDYWVVLSVATG